MPEDPVNVSDLNQYLYCPRRLYYLMFYQTQEINVHLADGRELHTYQGRRGGWYRDVYVKSDRLHLHGRVDLVEDDHGVLIPVERKRGNAFYENDMIQLAAYAMLLEEYIGKRVTTGHIYLYGTNSRHPIEISDALREKVLETVEAIRSMHVDSIPGFCDNPRKCAKCSVFVYCMPYEARVLEEA